MRRAGGASGLGFRQATDCVGAGDDFHGVCRRADLFSAFVSDAGRAKGIETLLAYCFVNMKNQATSATTNKELDVDILKHLSAIHRSEFQGRTNYQWKVFFTASSLMVLATAAILKQEVFVAIPSFIAETPSVIWSFFSLVGIFVSLMLYRFQVANEMNKFAAQMAEKHLENIYNHIGFSQKMPGSHLKMFENRPSFKLSLNLRGENGGPWLLFWQSSTLILVGVICSFLICSKLKFESPVSNKTPVQQKINAPL